MRSEMALKVEARPLLKRRRLQSRGLTEVIPALLGLLWFVIAFYPLFYNTRLRKPLSFKQGMNERSFAGTPGGGNC
jgi:hypothetical protein